MSQHWPLISCARWRDRGDKGPKRGGNDPRVEKMAPKGERMAPKQGERMIPRWRKWPENRGRKCPQKKREWPQNGGREWPQNEGRGETSSGVEKMAPRAWVLFWGSFPGVFFIGHTITNPRFPKCTPAWLEVLLFYLNCSVLSQISWDSRPSAARVSFPGLCGIPREGPTHPRNSSFFPYIPGKALPLHCTVHGGCFHVGKITLGLG